MFKLSVPIIKSFQDKLGKIIVEGIASDPTIDRDEERFDASALLKMASSVSERQIPIRMEHENKVYTEIGMWKEARINEDGKLYVKGEIDTELSLGKDIGVLLGRGVSLALSVGGQVLDAGYEYNNDLKKNIKVYKDVILNEISVIKNPSNYNVSLTIAKSVDWQKLNTVEKTEGTELEYTTEAQKISEVYKAMEKVSNEEFVIEDLVEKYFDETISDDELEIEFEKNAPEVIKEALSIVDEEELIENLIDKYYDDEVSEQDLEKDFDEIEDEFVKEIFDRIDEEEEQVTKYGKPGRSGRKKGSNNPAKNRWKRAYSAHRAASRFGAGTTPAQAKNKMLRNKKQYGWLHHGSGRKTHAQAGLARRKIRGSKKNELDRYTARDRIRSRNSAYLNFKRQPASWYKRNFEETVDNKIEKTERMTEAQKMMSVYKTVENVDVEKALTTAERNALPDSSFAYVEDLGDGKKVRKLPIPDAKHVANALAVLGGAMGGVKGIPADKMAAVKAKVEAAAKKFKIGQYAEKDATEANLENLINKYFDETISDEEIEKEFDNLPEDQYEKAVDMLDSIEYQEEAITKYFDDSISEEDTEKAFEELDDNEYENVMKMIDKEEEEFTKYGKPGRSGRKPGGAKSTDTTGRSWNKAKFKAEWGNARRTRRTLEERTTFARWNKESRGQKKTRGLKETNPKFIAMNRSANIARMKTKYGKNYSEPIYDIFIKACGGSMKEKTPEDMLNMKNNKKKPMKKELNEEELENLVDKYFDEKITEEELTKEVDELSDESFEKFAEYTDAIESGSEEEVLKYGKPGRSGRKPGGGNPARAKWKAESRRHRLEAKRSRMQYTPTGFGWGHSKAGFALARRGKKYDSIFTRSALEKLQPWFEKFQKDSVIGSSEVEDDTEEQAFTADDVKMMAELITIMNTVELPTDEDRPALLDDENYWGALTEEMQVVLYNRNMTAPHHNLDLSLNEELVLWQTKQLVDSKGWYTPKDFAVVVEHLYRHLKELSLVKSYTDLSEEAEDFLNKYFDEKLEDTEVEKAFEDLSEDNKEEVDSILYKEEVINKYFDDAVSEEDLEKAFDDLSDAELEEVIKEIDDEENNVEKYGKPGRSGRKPGGGNPAKAKWKAAYGRKRAEISGINSRGQGGFTPGRRKAFAIRERKYLTSINPNRKHYASNRGLPRASRRERRGQAGLQRQMAGMKAFSRFVNRSHVEVTPEEMTLFKNCDVFVKGNSLERPTLNNNNLSDEQIAKCAKAYQLIINHNSIMNKQVKTEEVVDKKKAKKVEPAVEAEEVKEEVKVEEPAVEEVKEEPVTEPAVEEVKEEVVEEEEVKEEEEKEEEEAEKAVVETPAEPVVEKTAEVVVEKAVETPAEVVVEKAAEPVVVEKTVIKEVFNKEAFASVEKSVGQLAEIVNGLVEKSKQITDLETTVKSLSDNFTKQTELLAEMSKVSLGRKSYAVIEKNFQNSHQAEGSQEEALKKMDEGVSFTEAYKMTKHA